MINVPQVLIVFLISCSIIGCGGSGSGENSESNFSLIPPNYFTVGFNESYSISGTDSQNGTYTGNFSYQTQALTSYNGAQAIPVVQSLVFTSNQTGATSTSVATEYYALSESTFELLGFSTDTLSIATANPVAIPTTVMIGDFGAAGSYIDNTGNSHVSSWRLENAGDSNAKFTLVSTTTQPGGEIESTSETTQIIDSIGNRLSVALRLTIPASGISVTLSGMKN